MKEHYKDLYETAINELKFERLSVEYLCSVIEEIRSITDDELTRGVIENAINRHNLDKLIHSKQLSKKDNHGLEN